MLLVANLPSHDVRAGTSGLGLALAIIRVRSILVRACIIPVRVYLERILSPGLFLRDRRSVASIHVYTISHRYDVQIGILTGV